MAYCHLARNELLTGNPFVDNGLAVIAALANCKQIEDLTVREMKRVHGGDGRALARNNDRLKSTSSVFLDSMLTNPSYRKNLKRLENYAKMTKAILENIEHETIQESCDICGNATSVDLDKLFRDTFGEDSAEAKARHYIDRGWFPLVGSVGSDAQALPAASRSLNCCAKCLFAVQYLPAGVFSTKGRLTVFQSTSISFWYRLVKQFVDEINKRLTVTTDKVETIGTKKEKEGRGGTSAAIARMLAVMKDIERFDPGISVTMWLFSNLQAGDCDKERIPNFALTFLYKATKHGLTNEITQLTNREKNYQNSLLNCIINRVDYLPLYPSKKYGKDGASDELFMLYQINILNYPVRSLGTAYKIAQYVEGKTDDVKLGIDIDKTGAKKVKVKELIVDMVEEGQITFDEYYDLFVGSGSGSNPWALVKYYLLAEVKEYRAIEDDGDSKKMKSSVNQQQHQEYKARVVSVGKAIYDSYIRRRGRARFEREVLGGLAHNQIHRQWLRTQLERLADEAEENSEGFDLEANWKALLNRQGEEGVYELLYLFRLLWNGWTYIKR